MVFRQREIISYTHPHLSYNGVLNIRENHAFYGIFALKTKESKEKYERNGIYKQNQ